MVSGRSIPSREQGTTLRPVILLTLLISLCTSCAANRAYSDPVREEVADSLFFPVDGARLYLLVRGQRRDAPILIWLHGGPGGAERPLYRMFNSELEREFIVAYWDQRGAGRSFDSEADPSRLTIQQHLNDLDRVVDYLRQTHRQGKVALLGHSWGSALGLLYVRDHAEKISAFIGIGQVVSTAESARAQLAFVESEARKRGETDDLHTSLQDLGEPPLGWREDLALQRWVDRYGGVFHNPPSRWGTVFKGLGRGYVTPSDAEPRCASEHSATNTLRSGARVLRLSSGRGRPNSRPWPTRG